MNRVGAVSRNCAFINTSDGRQIEVPVKGTNKNAVVGDYCVLSHEEKNFSLLPRTNLLARSYRKKTKNLAANIDHLFVVTAIKPGVNTLFIDRTLSSCRYENISASILLNKSDLDYSAAKDIIENYKHIGVTTHVSCTKSVDGCLELLQFIGQNKFSTVALCGISGVGKSSLLNKLVPNAERTVGRLSEKNDIGKQTTSMAKLFPTVTDAGHQYEVIDLPGLQHFGICNIPLDALTSTFVEFLLPGEQCRFNDCSHTNEPDCVILSKLATGNIAQSRYTSYLDMRNEIISALPFYGKSN